jgi:hypothetical protein
MRTRRIVTGLVLAGAALVAAPAARADAPTPAVRGTRDAREALPARAAPRASPRPGTDEEADEYARREAASPKVQKFVGGFIVFLLVVTVLVLLIILLAKQI